jgi:hypothetical protein
MTETQSKLTDLFAFLREVAKRKSPLRRRTEDHGHQLRLRSLPDHPTISLTTIDEENGASDGEVLVIDRPELASCPKPPPEIADWLLPGWQEQGKVVEVRPVQQSTSKDGKVVVEAFAESTSRVVALKSWKEVRDRWIANSRPAREAMQVFLTVYEWYGILQRQADPMDLFLGDGILECLDSLGAISHPILLRRVSLEFRPESTPPQFVIRRSEKSPELYLDLLHQVSGADTKQIGECKNELASAEFEPLGGDATEGFLRRLVHGVFADRGVFQSEGESSTPDQIVLRRDPVLFLTRKPEGAVGIFDAVLEDIARRTDFSEALLNIIGLGDPKASTDVDDTASFAANEDADILLCKEANKEQLQVAKQLTRHSCVVVQGPPGTGKTHTIANLLGHLLASGKRVLVTAHTPKALRVLRHKVVKSLQPLCLSVLQKDRKSQDEMEATVTEIQARVSQDPSLLEQRATQLRGERSRVIAEIREVRGKLLQARQDEVTPIVFGSYSLRPIDAAELVRSRQECDGWIPGDIVAGWELLLSNAEISDLYRTNLTLCGDDERQLGCNRPDLNRLPTAFEFERWVMERDELSALDLEHGQELWDREHRADDMGHFDQMLDEARRTILFLADMQSWQLEAIQAGRDGEVSRGVWNSLLKLIADSWTEVNRCRELVIELGPEIDDPRDPEEIQPILRRIIDHLEAGESFGLITKLTKADCHALMARIRINSRPAGSREIRHFLAAEALVRIQILRRTLRQRWERMITALKGPGTDELTEEPENVCRGFATQIQTCLDWHQSTWSPLESRFVELGFRWSTYLTRIPPETGSNAELRRLQKAVSSDLEAILQIRAARILLCQLDEKWAQWGAQMTEPHAAEATVVRSLRRALASRNKAAYADAYMELERLHALERDFELRRTLLPRLASVAPTWANQISHRMPGHAGGRPPGEASAAWDWRQIRDELERRAAISMPALQKRIDDLNQRLVGSDTQPGLTAELVENATWAHLIRNTTFEQKQALGAYAKLRSKMTKSGTGVRDRELRDGARRAMSNAVGAVPVWIMPLAEVAETFDPRENRFDVVIIDEASQCDAAALFALYMGKQCVVVGDDQQVSPLGVGQAGEDISRLISLNLQNIPYPALYDSTTSIYDLAQTFFAGRVIQLREHFRCAPDII